MDGISAIFRGGVGQSQNDDHLLLGSIQFFLNKTDWDCILRVLVSQGKLGNDWCLLSYAWIFNRDCLYLAIPWNMGYIFTSLML